MSLEEVGRPSEFWEEGWAGKWGRKVSWKGASRLGDAGLCPFADAA